MRLQDEISRSGAQYDEEIYFDSDAYEAVESRDKSTEILIFYPIKFNGKSS